MLSSQQSGKAKPLSEAGLRQLIRKALERGWVREGWHSEVERSDRNISNEDLIYGLERKDWKLTEIREHPKHGFSYTISTKDIEGEDLTICVSPKSDQTVKIVTKY